MENSEKKPENSLDLGRRKVLLINRKFQLSFLSYTLSIAVTVMAVFFVANRYFFWAFARKGQAMGLDEGHIFFRFLAEQRWTMDLIYLATGAVVCAILLAHGLYLSNRVAGPLYNLQKYLQDYLSGRRQGTLQFREKDYFQELASVVSETVERSRVVKPAAEKRDQQAS
jgi:hypothetical protein